MEHSYRTMSLSQLLEQSWNEDDLDTQIVYQIQRLWGLPLKDYAPSDIREIIEHKIGIRYLVPLAIELLCEEPLLESEFYPGDLLRSVLRVRTEYWLQHTFYKDKLVVIANRALAEMDRIQDYPTQMDVLRNAINAFLMMGKR
jgi:hypothetical protein